MYVADVQKAARQLVAGLTTLQRAKAGFSSVVLFWMMLAYGRWCTATLSRATSCSTAHCSPVKHPAQLSNDEDSILSVAGRRDVGDLHAYLWM